MPTTALYSQPNPENTPELSSSRIDWWYQAITATGGSPQVSEFAAASLAANLRLAVRLDPSLEVLWDENDLLPREPRLEIKDEAETFAKKQLVAKPSRDCLERWLAAVIEEAAADYREMYAIKEARRRDINKDYLELRSLADNAAIRGALASGLSGMSSEGSLALYQEALSDLRKAMSMGIGHWDLSAWFEMGWFLWKSQNSFDEAAKAFDRAAELAAQTSPRLELICLRHLTHMRYLSGDFPAAHSSAMQTLCLKRSQETLFEAARCSAALGDQQEAIDLLKECVQDFPVAYIDMLACPDFNSMTEPIVELAVVLSNVQREIAEQLVDGWASALRTMDVRSSEAKCSLSFPPSLFSDIDDFRELSKEANYITSREITRQAAEKAEALFKTAEAVLTFEIGRRRQAATRVEAEIAESKHRFQELILAAREIMNEEIKAASRVRDGSVKPDLGPSGVIAALLSLFVLYITRNLTKGLAAFLPVLIGTAAVRFVCKGSAALVRWTSAVKNAKMKYAQATVDADLWLRKTLPNLQQSADDLASLCNAAASALAKVQAREHSGKNVHVPPA